MNRVWAWCLGVVVCGCASTATTGNGTFIEQAPTSLPNGTMQTALPMALGQPMEGAINCNEAAWYTFTATGGSVLTLRAEGQVQGESTLGALTAFSVLDGAQHKLAESVVPAEHRAPEWDARTIQVMIPATGAYYMLVEETVQNCQRMSWRFSLR